MVVVGIANMMLLLVNLHYFQHIPTGQVPKIPEGWGPLFAALIALSGVLWQTNRAFTNLIKSQKSQADITRDQIDKTNEYNWLDRQHERAEQRLSLLSTLAAEMRNGRDRLAELKAVCQTLAQTYSSPPFPAKVPAPDFPRFECDLYKANLSKLDMMDPHVVEPIIRGYAILFHCLNLPAIDPNPANWSVSMTAFAGAIDVGINDMEAILGTLTDQERVAKVALAKMASDMRHPASPSN